MIRTLLYTSSGARDCNVDYQNWSFRSWFAVGWRLGAVSLEWCPGCRLKHDWSFHVVCGGWELMAVSYKQKKQTSTNFSEIFFVCSQCQVVPVKNWGDRALFSSCSVDD